MTPALSPVPDLPSVSPLFVTRDEPLLEELLRLAAAAGVTPEVAREPVAALRSWLSAPIVLIGVDVAAEVAKVSPPRRPRVHLVAWGTVPDLMFRTALELGAEDIAALPRSDAWLIEEMTDLSESAPRDAVTIGVIGGSGGAGATSFACALGQFAGRRGQSLVIDTDPSGPGVDQVLGLETEYGIRWDALQQTTGRLSARSLREAVPRRGGVGALTWSPGPQGTVQAFAVREALSAAQRGHETVILDFARQGDPLIDEIAARCDRVVVVVQPQLSGVASAARICARLSGTATLGIVVRGSGVDDREIAEVTQAPVITTMPHQRGLDEAIGLGAGPIRSWRGPLARAAREVLVEVRQQ